MEYLRERAKHFWIETLSVLQDTLPTKYSKSAEGTHFKIIIPVYNAEQWIERAIKSVKEQEYGNYQCIIANDMSTDSTFQKCLDATEGNPKFKLVDNLEKKFALGNIYDSIGGCNPSPEDVIITLDGDDWLSTRFVLSKLDEYYTNTECLMTYGSFIQFPSGIVGQEASPYPEEVINSGTYRRDRWRASHLKTFKSLLWDKVDVGDLKDSDGKFFEMTYDQAMMLPMLEMSGDKSQYVPEIMYVYNVANPNAINKTRAQKQHNLMIKIRNKRPYKRQF
jgi:glycosyltransferase involved in cell wall biosynthesis